MTVLGARAAKSFGSQPDIKAWTDRVPLNPARIPPDYPGSADLDDAVSRLQTHMDTGMAKLAAWSL
jgi:hypothetical protein